MKRLTILLASLVGLSTASQARTVGDDRVTIAHDCAKDPNVTINANNDTVTLAGPCAQVTINGNQANVHGSSASITVNGNNNTVVADAVDNLAVSGNNNTVSYKAGIKGDTKVTNPGHNNTVTHAK